MTKKKKRILIPLIIIAAILTYCWTIILTTEILATWRHYFGLVLFIAIIIFLLKDKIITSILTTGIYLLLAIINLIAMTANISTSWIRIGPISTPPIQLMSLGLFIIYFWLNLNSLIDIYMEYEVTKLKKAQK